jgi:predicted O-methyltransferase YrrM
VAQDTWTAVDDYVTGLLVTPDEALDGAVRAGETAGLPQIQVSPPLGKLLYLLGKTVGARSILEFGTLAGYSTIWLARALPADGRLISLEANGDYAAVASASIAAAGLGEIVEVRVGPALDQLPQLDADGVGPFDLTFIDADKVHTPDYFSWALEHSRPGSLIVADNVIRDGRLPDLADDDPVIVAQRRFHELLVNESRVEATTIQTVGAKGYDGFSLVRVLD